MEYYQNINNHKKAQIKQLIEDSLQQALEYKMIQNYCEVEFGNPIRKAKIMNINQLSRLIVGQSKSIRFYEVLQKILQIY